MSKVKELWQYAILRFLVLAVGIGGGSFLVFWLMFAAGIKINGVNTGEDEAAFWSFGVFPISIFVWVWRKPVWKLVEAPVRFLNRIAEEE